MSEGSRTPRAPQLLRAGTRLPIAVPAAGRLYEGHFPGRPILPGIGLLDLALGALAAAGGSRELSEIVQLRLRRLLLPGEDVELEVKAIDGDGRCRFEASRAGQVVANGIVVLGRSATGPAPVAVAASDRRPAAHCDLDDLLPHRPPMRFVESVEFETEGGLVCAVGVPARSPFVTGGFAPALVTLEMAAQTAAALESRRRLGAGEARGTGIGYLVGAREVRFARDRVPVATRMTASVRRSWVSPPLSAYDFDVSHEGEVVASGLLSAWLMPTGA